MSDPTGGPSSLGIEAVEWLAEAGENSMLRVTGRWRRRRPTWSGQPMLVIEVQGQRHRFPAMPEPPSLTGAAPGTWRMTFSVPASLAPHLGGRAWLALGAVVVPLPAAVEPALGAAPEPGEEQPPPETRLEADPGLLVERRLRSYELAVEAARRRAVDAETTAEDLSARVDQLELELERLSERLADRERARRSAEQRAHSERVVREELQEELAEWSRSREDTAGALAELAEAELRIVELEEEIEILRRRVDEAEQLAAAAQVERRRTERQVTVEQEPRFRESSARAAGIQAELALTHRTPVLWPHGATSQALSAPPAPADGDGRLLSLERELAAWRESTATRAEPPVGVEPPPVGVEPPPVAVEPRPGNAEQPPVPPGIAATAPPERLAEALSQLRAELNELRAGAERESSAREEAQALAASLERRLVDQTARSARAYEAIEALRLELEAVRLAAEVLAGVGARPEPVFAVPGRSEPDDVQIDPARLAAALVRLREAAGVPAEEELTPPGSAAQPLARPWLPRVFRALAARDPAAAGRLAVALLPAQRLPDREPIEYDLVLADLGCVQVSAAAGRPRIDLVASPRPRGEIDFRVVGDLAGLARLLTAGRLRRRLGRGLAGVEGEAEAFAELRGLIRTPLGLSGLHAAGVRTDPWLSLSLAALLIDPDWSTGERFTIAHTEPGARSAAAYLHVWDDAPPAVTRIAPTEGETSIIVCPQESLLLVLEGSATVDAELRGDERPLAVLQGWVKRAQSG